MQSHSVSLDLYDQSARVLAVDFTTRRVIATWGSGCTSWHAGFELRGDTWHRFTVSQIWGSSASGLAKRGGPDLGPCEGDLLVKSEGPGVLPLVRWLVAAGVPVTVCRGGAEQTRAIAAWVKKLRRSLVGGADLSEMLEQHRVALTGAARIDTLLLALCRAGVCRPYCLDPQPGTYADGDGIRAAQGLPLALALDARGPIATRKSPGFEGYTDAQWAAHEEEKQAEWALLCRRFGVVKTSARTVQHTGSATGSIFWTFTQGWRFDSLPDFD